MERLLYLDICYGGPAFSVRLESEITNGHKKMCSDEAHHIIIRQKKRR